MWSANKSDSKKQILKTTWKNKCIILYVEFIIIYFVRSQTSILLHVVFYGKCKVSLFHIIILQLLLLCTVKPANIEEC